ncbi:hypothetical protein [Reticulibacter mediterranei]|uniref:hypothetical protein n=1 Tax=Reticulibacter mediterranei TaxID=2778369 RepID=UPI001C688407|nr:hypothetical protein [Reticulibacter mediterranei]
MTRMSLIKTPSQHFSSSRSRASRHLQQVGSRTRGLVTERVESTYAAIGSTPEHPSCFMLIALRSLCSSCCFSGVTAWVDVHPAACVARQLSRADSLRARIQALIVATFTGNVVSRIALTRSLRQNQSTPGSVFISWLF